MSGEKIITGLQEAIEHAKSMTGPRVTLGLEAAHAGDPKGVERFLRFVKTELEMMAIADLPEEVKRFVSELARNTRSAADFIYGFNEGREMERKRKK